MSNIQSVIQFKDPLLLYPITPSLKQAQKPALEEDICCIFAFYIPSCPTHFFGSPCGEGDEEKE